MLTQYNQWIFENGSRECVDTLKKWIIQESEFCTVARETVDGLSSGKIRSGSRNLGGVKKTTFFGTTDNRQEDNRSNVRKAGFIDNKNGKQRLCKVCNGRHGVWACDVFRKIDVNQRWNVAKQFKLCFRCLGDGNQCICSKVCDIHGCEETHSILLHNIGNKITDKQTRENTRIIEDLQSTSS